MQLRVLDLRENRLQSIHLSNGAAFLRNTIVLMWDNPFDQDPPGFIAKEFMDPAHFFRASTDFDDDPLKILSPLHLYHPLDNRSPIMQLISELL
jgi:hypothetical protein